MFRLLLPVLFLFSCRPAYKSHRDDYSLPAGRPSYDQPDFWAAHPWKKDPSDSLPDILQQASRDSLADVFFIHPTTYTHKRKGWNASLDDAMLNAKTDYTSILYQASAFNQHARVFAPRYRQVHLSAFFHVNDITRASFDTAYSDVRQAFIYYLTHFNKGRPIIIAGHSQGGLMAERLLKEFFDGRPLMKQLVAAYIIGWPVPWGTFAGIPVCADPVQTGCFCGWRTLKVNYIAPYMKVEDAPSYITNPLSWDTTLNPVPAARNQGSVLRNFKAVIPHTTGAVIHGDVLWVDRPSFPGSAFFRRRNYHIADINLFYMTIRQNLEQRIFAFKAKSP